MDKLILIVDDEKNITDILTFILEKDGYRTLAAYDGPTGLDLALSENPDLILLDVMLPGMDGFEVCRTIRSKRNTPIIMLTARDEEVDKVLGLELGADDYITKPFSNRELLARVKANLRRQVPDNTPSGEVGVLQFGDLEVDREHYEVRKNGQTIDLTLREFELLKFLSSAPSKIYSRETLLEKVWGYEYYGDVRTVDVTVRRLREKIEDDPSAPIYIATKRGVGYYFNK